MYYLQNSTHSVFSLSAEGTLAFVPGVPGRRSLVWVDPDGGVEPILEQDEIDAYSRLGGSLSLSPDGSSVLVGGGGDIVEIELDRKLPRRITFGDGNDIRPYWTDGSARVFYNSNRDTRWSVWAASTSGAGEPELILQIEQNIFLTSVGPSGELLLEVRSEGRLQDVMLYEPGQEPRFLVQSQFDEFQGAFSNDGRWIAYVSNVTGRNEVYVINKEGGAPMQVSVGGGMAPKWGPTGTTLYYRRGRGVHRFMLGEDGRPTGEPEAVFNAPNLLTQANYDFTPDESRMLAVQLDDEAIADEIRIITNFFDRIEAVAGPGTQ